MASVLSISTPSATLTFSDLDSDAAAAILHHPTRHRPAHPSTTRRTQPHVPPTPGTRRYRRYLNALLSADEGEGSSSEWYSASEGEREEGEAEVWRSEWRGEFVKVGEDFFDGRVGLGTQGGQRVKGRGGGYDEEETGSRLQRRVKTMERERMERRRERRERLERKQKRLTTVDQLTTSASSDPSSPAMSGGLEDGSLASLRAQREHARMEQDDFVLVDAHMDSKDAELQLDHHATAPQNEQKDELMMTNIIAGDGQLHHSMLLHSERSVT